MDKTLIIASDHAGYALKRQLGSALAEWGFTVEDIGARSEESVDYPDFGNALARRVAAGAPPRGVLVCGTGIGIAIAANRHKGVRAAVCAGATAARLSRRHNDANVLALGARLIGLEVALDCLKIFLETPFDGGRHARRVAKLG